MKKKKMFLLCAVLAFAVIAGCKSSGTGNNVTQGNRIYYLTKDGTTFTSVEFEIDEEKLPQDTAMEMLLEMKDVQTEYMSVIPDTVEVIAAEFVEGSIIVSLSKEYLSLGVVDKSLCNAGIVFTLAQIEGVTNVKFKVDDVLVTNELGEVIAYAPSDFSSSAEEVMDLYSVEKITLYLTNETGKELEKYSFDGAFPENTSMEKFIIEQLLTWDDGSYVSAIPKGTKLLNVTTKDSICYVNFDSTFATGVIGVEPAITIYSVVNSLTELSYVNYVQISVDGNNHISIGDISLENSFSANWNYLKTAQ